MTYLTPEKAKKETCPHMTYCVNPYSVMQDNQSAMHENPRCMGDDCKMAWRWADAAHTRGYCGIAGKP